MPKLKTHKGAAKRFKKTASGAFKRRKANARHLFACKSNANKRRLGQPGTVSSANYDAVSSMLPYA
jgi:large subunit ribosomal protein L35